MLVLLLLQIILAGQPWPCPDHGHFDFGKNNCVCDEGFNWDGQHCIQDNKQPWPCPAHGHFDFGKNNCVCDDGFNWDGQHCIQYGSAGKIQHSNTWETCDGNCANPTDICCVANGDGDKRTCRPHGQDCSNAGYMTNILASNSLLNVGDNDPARKFKEAITKCDSNGCNNARSSFETEIWSTGFGGDFCYGAVGSAQCTIIINGRFPSRDIALILKNLMTYSVDALAQTKSVFSSRRECPLQSCFKAPSSANLTTRLLQKRATLCPKIPCECQKKVEHTNFMFPDALEITNYLNNGEQGYIRIETQCSFADVDQKCPSWFGLVSSAAGMAVTAATAEVPGPFGGLTTWGLNLMCTVSNSKA